MSQKPVFKIYTNKEFVSSYARPEENDLSEAYRNGGGISNENDLIDYTYDIIDCIGWSHSDRLPWIAGLITIALVEGKAVGRTCIFWDEKNNAEFGGTDIIALYQGKGICRPLVAEMLQYFLGYAPTCVLMFVNSRMIGAVFCYVKAALQTGYEVYLYDRGTEDGGKERGKELGKQIISTGRGVLKTSNDNIIFERKQSYQITFLFVKVVNNTVSNMSLKTMRLRF